MRRYRRKSRAQRIKFQWYFDFSTSAQSMQIITVQAGGQTVYERLKPFFAAFKYYKLGSVKCTFVPASTLPVDPTGLSYEAGENTVDPRDQLNMGLTRITNGEDFIDDISGLSELQQQKLYDMMLMDPRWYKWSLQSGLKRRAYPKYWQIGQLHQDYYPGATINLPGYDTVSSPNSTFSTTLNADGGQPSGMSGHLEHYSDPRGIFQTGHKGRLSWMPTDSLVHYARNDGMSDKPSVAPIPCIDLFKIITPKAHKTLYYYRCYVTEEVSFHTPITVMGIDDRVSQAGGMLDRFIMGDVKLAYPTATAGTADYLQPPNDGAGK